MVQLNQSDEIPDPEQGQGEADLIEGTRIAITSRVTPDGDTSEERLLQLIAIDGEERRTGPLALPAAVQARALYR